MACAMFNVLGRQLMDRHPMVVGLLPLSTVGPPTIQVLICSVPYACTALTELLACTPWETN